jgi:hypothetical protein
MNWFVRGVGIRIVRKKMHCIRKVRHGRKRSIVFSVGRKFDGDSGGGGIADGANFLGERYGTSGTVTTNN